MCVCVCVCVCRGNSVGCGWHHGRVAGEEKEEGLGKLCVCGWGGGATSGVSGQGWKGSASWAVGESGEGMGQVGWEGRSRLGE